MNGIIITIEKEELAILVQQAIEKALAALGLNKAPEPEDIMTVDEVASWLRICKTQIYQKTHYKTIPFNKKGKRLYFSRADLKAWLADGRVKTKFELIELADERLIQIHKSKHQ